MKGLGNGLERLESRGAEQINEEEEEREAGACGQQGLTQCIQPPSLQLGDDEQEGAGSRGERGGMVLGFSGPHV